jgi:transposase
VSREAHAGICESRGGATPPGHSTHDAWLRRQRFDSRPLAVAFDECYAAVAQAKACRDALDRAIAELAAEPPFGEIVGRLCCLRGVSTLTALALTVELDDWGRFRPQASARFLA